MSLLSHTGAYSRLVELGRLCFMDEKARSASHTRTDNVTVQAGWAASDANVSGKQDVSTRAKLALSPWALALTGITQNTPPTGLGAATKARDRQCKRPCYCCQLYRKQSSGHSKTDSKTNSKTNSISHPTAPDTTISKKTRGGELRRWSVVRLRRTCGSEKPVSQSRLQSTPNSRPSISRSSRSKSTSSRPKWVNNDLER